MSRNPLLCSLLSTSVPGLGQIYCGKTERGAAILLAVLVVGNLNAIWLSLLATTSPDSNPFWNYEPPLILHDLFGAYGIVFLIWQILDAYQQANRQPLGSGAMS